MTEAERSLLGSFITARRWHFASTMPDNPHWYTVRCWCPEGEADFEEFIRILRRCGDDEVFQGRPYRYLDFDGHHYWTMGAPIVETTVINRKPLSRCEPPEEMTEPHPNQDTESALWYHGGPSHDTTVSSLPVAAIWLMSCGTFPAGVPSLRDESSLLERVTSPAGSPPPGTGPRSI